MNVKEEKQQLRLQIDELKSKIKPLQDRLNEIYQDESKSTEKKLKECMAGINKFELDELRFSAHAICECGAGLAYPKEIGMGGCWDCSDILLGRAIPAGKEGSKMHSGSMPFAFYEIKSEDQPSAEGATTRPKE